MRNIKKYEEYEEGRDVDFKRSAGCYIDRFLFTDEILEGIHKSRKKMENGKLLVSGCCYPGVYWLCFIEGQVVAKSRDLRV